MWFYSHIHLIIVSQHKHTLKPHSCLVQTRANRGAYKLEDHEAWSWRMSYIKVVSQIFQIYVLSKNDLCYFPFPRYRDLLDLHLAFIFSFFQMSVLLKKYAQFMLPSSLSCFIRKFNFFTEALCKNEVTKVFF